MPLFDDPRNSWGATPSTNPVPLDRARVTEFVNHWDGDGISTTSDHRNCLAFVKAIQNYHMGTKGWADIGYTGLVCQHGRKIEGRGWNVGAHTAGHNETAVGWCLLAGPKNPVTDVMKAAQVDARLATEDALSRTLRPFCHRDFAATDCPGDDVFAWVQAGMVSPLQEESMTKEQAAELIAAMGRQTKALEGLSEAVTAVRTSLVDFQQAQINGHETLHAELVALGTTLPEQLGIRVATVATQSIVETLQQELGGIELTARYLRR